MLDLEEGRTLVKLARKTIRTYLEEGKKPDPPEDVSEALKKDRGVFVTLNKNGKLRGCIGRPLPTQPLIDGLMDSAVNSATGDPRFPNLDSEELKDTTIEVSVLTLPEKIDVEDPKSYPENVEIGRDGLIAKSGGREGLLLPQVPVDQGWDSEEFISQTCVKAGLSPNSWLREDVEIERFSGQIFKEKVPGGEIVRENFSV